MSSYLNVFDMQWLLYFCIRSWCANQDCYLNAVRYEITHVDFLGPQFATLVSQSMISLGSLSLPSSRTATSLNWKVLVGYRSSTTPFVTEPSNVNSLTFSLVHSSCAKSYLWCIWWLLDILFQSSKMFGNIELVQTCEAAGKKNGLCFC